LELVTGAHPVAAGEGLLADLDTMIHRRTENDGAEMEVHVRIVEMEFESGIVGVKCLLLFAGLRRLLVCPGLFLPGKGIVDVSVAGQGDGH